MLEAGSVKCARARTSRLREKGEEREKREKREGEGGGEEEGERQ